MHDRSTVESAFELALSGMTQQQIAEALGIGQSTVSRWLRRDLASAIDTPMRAKSRADCPDRCPVVAQAPEAPYAYLLGHYLGDGTIVHTRRGVHRLFISCCAAYPDIVDECTRAIEAVLPRNRVGHRSKPGAVDVNCYSTHLPCVFPQHGPGRKHDRPITLSRRGSAR